MDNLINSTTVRHPVRTSESRSTPTVAQEASFRRTGLRRDGNDAKARFKQRGRRQENVEPQRWRRSDEQRLGVVVVGQDRFDVAPATSD